MKQQNMTKTDFQTLEHYGLLQQNLKEMRVQEYRRGEFICMQGQQLSNIYIVVSGKAKVYCTIETGKCHLLCFYRSGGIIGELELMTDNFIAQSSVEAITDVRCLMIPIAVNKAEFFQNNIFLTSIGKILARKLTRSSENIVHMILYPLETRLCSYLYIANRNGLFKENLTELAQLLGTSYRHLLRALNQLVQDEILKKTSSGYVIINQEELKNKSKSFYEDFERDMVFDFI